MIGSYDFCGHYEFTFSWLDDRGGIEAVREYWNKAISVDAQQHVRELIIREGIAGMNKYWDHTLEEEAADHSFTADKDRFRIDMHACPSKGFLLRNDLEQYADYCDHCIGWIGPLMRDAGFTVDHEHDHCGKCWWEFRKMCDQTPPSQPGGFSAEKDVRLSEEWNLEKLDTFRRAEDDRTKA